MTNALIKIKPYGLLLIRFEFIKTFNRNIEDALNRIITIASFSSVIMVAPLEGIE